MSIHARLNTILGATSVLSDLLTEVPEITSGLQEVTSPQEARNVFAQAVSCAHDIETAAEEGLQCLDQFRHDPKGVPGMNDDPVTNTESRYPTIIAATAAFSSALSELNDIHYRIERETDRIKLSMLFARASACADQIRNSALAAVNHSGQFRFDAGVSGDNHDEHIDDEKGTSQ